MKTIVDYAQLVKQQHALNISLAPVEADPTASSKAYAIGQHFILDGELYKAKTAIALGDALVLDTNYEAAGSIEAQIETLDAENQTLTNNVDGNWSNGGKNILDYYAWKKVTTYISRGTAVWENNGISITATGDDAYCNAAYHVPVKEGNTYCLSWEENSNKSGTIYVFPNGLSTGMVTVNNSAAKSLNYTVGAGITFITFRFGVATNGDTISYKNIQIEQGNSATPYVPYAKTNRELTGDIEPMLNVLGAKNLLKNTASSTTVNGITFTVNADGSVTVNGTATGNAYIRAANITDKTCVLNKGKYTFNGCPAGGSLSGYYAYVTDDTTSFNDIGDGVDFTISSDNTPLAVVIYVRNGTTVSNLVFKPMIRPASIEDDTYVPYAMTNRELTDSIANSYVFKGMESKTVTGDGVKTYKQLIEELRNTVNSYVTSLGAEYYIITRAIEIWSIQYNAISPKLAKILYDCRYRGFYFDGANAARIRECFPSTSTNTYLKELVFNTSPTIAINDMSDTTLASGATIVAHFEVYKKV